jgi:histidinol-phosphate aminotransferase
VPSSTNFILTRVPGGSAARVYQALKDKGILVRYYDLPRLSDKLRITIGTEQQNTALIRAIKEIGAVSDTPVKPGEDTTSAWPTM